FNISIQCIYLLILQLVYDDTISTHHTPSLLFFFFQCSRHPRDLHSFPTRRSSDLLRAARGRRRRQTECGSLPRRGGRGPGETHTDRKSTRLNSSHSQISYAVFCLKKKKKKKTKITQKKKNKANNITQLQNENNT